MIAEARRLKNAARAAWRAARLRRGATPHEVVWRSGPVRLRRYLPDRAPTGTPLLLVMPIINRFRVADLWPEGSLVGSLVRRGIPVYLVDWGQPRRIDAGTGFEDYVLRLLPRIAAELPEGPFDLLGYCLGGTIATMFAARSPQRVRRLVTLNAPVDFSCDDAHMDLLKRWVESAHFPVEEITAAFGNMPGALVQQGFVWQRPLDSALKLARAWRRFDDPGFADLFGILESWNQDGVDVPGAAYRRLIGDLYRNNRLARGTFLLRGEPVELARITCPVLVISAKGDVICPPAAARALLDLVSSERTETLELPGGHITAVVGRKAPQRLHDPLADWLSS